MRWKKITLIGVGLLGGSLGIALRKRRLTGSVVGFVRHVASVRECERLGAVNVATRDLRQAVEGAELIVLCTPIAQMRPLVQQMLPWLKLGAIITDVGSSCDRQTFCGCEFQGLGREWHLGGGVTSDVPSPICDTAVTRL